MGVAPPARVVNGNALPLGEIRSADGKRSA
jgi:hypothetical protein